MLPDAVFLLWGWGLRWGWWGFVKILRILLVRLYLFRLFLGIFLFRGLLSLNWLTLGVRGGSTGGRLEGEAGRGVRKVAGLVQKLLFFVGVVLGWGDGVGWWVMDILWGWIGRGRRGGGVRVRLERRVESTIHKQVLNYKWLINSLLFPIISNYLCRFFIPSLLPFPLPIFLTSSCFSTTTNIPSTSRSSFFQRDLRGRPGKEKGEGLGLESGWLACARNGGGYGLGWFDNYR